MSVPLLPCAHCGGAEIRLSTRKTTIVECRGCGSMFIKLHKEDAISAWNTRFFGSTLTSDLAGNSEDLSHSGIHEQNASMRKASEK